MLNKIRALSRDRRGVSLLELLVAIAILAVMVSPLLGSFVSSANLAKRGREMADATNTLQNVVEIVQAHSMADIVERASALFGTTDVQFYSKSEDTYTLMTAPPEAGQGSYYIGLSGLTASSGRPFDAMLSIYETAEFQTLNTLEVTQYSPMDAVFTQPVGEDSNPDIQAALYISNEYMVETGDETITPEEILKRGMDRTIDIYVMNDTARSEVFAKCRFTYDYHLVDDTLGIDTHLTYESPSYEFYRGRYGDAPELSAVYFFFYPHYSYDSGALDIINVYNNREAGSGIGLTGEDLSFTLFLVKQRAVDMAHYLGATEETAVNSQINTWDSAYHAASAGSTTGYRVSLHQNAVVQPSCLKARLNSNINQSINDGTGTGGVYSCSGGGFSATVSFDTMMVVTEAEKRVYALSAELYEYGTVKTDSSDFTAAPGDDKHLLSYNTTKLN